jgi:hypothetical protein
MSVTFEDVDEYLNERVVTRQEFENLMKQCIKRSNPNILHGAFIVVHRSSQGPVFERCNMNELLALLSRLNVNLVTPTNAMKAMNWRTVVFDL